MATRRVWLGSLLMGLVAMVAFGPAGVAQAGKPELKGNFQVLNDEKSTHKPGKVQLIEFADFYCPHCHRFDGEGLAKLRIGVPERISAPRNGGPQDRY